MTNLDFPTALQVIVTNITGRLSRVENNTRAETAGAVKPLLFAVLPSAALVSKGSLLFVTNGRKTGEGVGAGTGVLVYSDGVAWRRTADDSTVAV